MELTQNDVQARFEQLVNEVPPIVNDKFTHSFSELWEAKDEEQKFLIPELLPSCAVAVILGEDGIGKTQVVVQLCLSIALRLPTFMGLPLCASVARALVVATEDSRQKFIKAAATQAIALKPDLDPSAVHLDFTEGSAFDTYESLIEEIEKQLCKHAYALVIVDALSDLFTLVDGEINSNTHARRILQVMQVLCERHSTTILIIHHVAKSKIEAKHKDGKLFVTKNDAQGAGAITQKPRTILALTHDARTITNSGQNYSNFLHVVKANLMSKFYVNNVLELSFDAKTLLHQFRALADREIYEKNGPSPEQALDVPKHTAPIVSSDILTSRSLHSQRCVAAFGDKKHLTRAQLVARLQTVYQCGANKIESKGGIITELLAAGLLEKDGRNYKLPAAPTATNGHVPSNHINWDDSQDFKLPQESTAYSEEIPPF